MAICPVARPWTNLFCLNSFFNFLVPPRVIFSRSPATQSGLRPHSSCWWNVTDLTSSYSFCMSSDVSWSCLNLDDIRNANCFLTSLSSKSLSFDHVSNKKRRFVGFPVWPRFRKLQETYYQMVISWQFSTSLHAIVQHIQKQIWRNFLIHARSITCLLVNLSVLEKGIHDAESVATTELQ